VVCGSSSTPKSFGYHPLLCFLDATGEALAGLLRPGNAGSNTTADHITVLDMALAQIPDAHRHGSDILIRTDSTGASHGFLDQIRSLREHGMRNLLHRRRDHRTDPRRDRGLPGLATRDQH
jgi:hypothetical protein